MFGFHKNASLEFSKALLTSDYKLLLTQTHNRERDTRNPVANSCHQEPTKFEK